MVDPDEMAAIARAGGVGEMLGHFFDAPAGRSRPSRRAASSTLPLAALRGRRIVAVAGGAIKADAIRAVLASGLLTGLITDERTARALAGHGARPDEPRQAAMASAP